MSIGANTSIDVRGDMRTVLDAIARAGFDCVMVHEKIGDLCDTIEYAQKLGLQIPFVHLDYGSMNDVWSADTRVRNREIERKINAMKICAAHGIKTVVIHPTKLRRNEPFIMNREIGLGSFRELAKVAERLDIKIALENLCDGNVEALEFLLDHLPHPNVGFCFDCGHYYLFTPGQHCHLMQKYSARCFAVHLQDNMRMVDTLNDQHLIPGDGVIDFAHVMHDIRRSAYGDGCVMLEIRHTNQFWNDPITNNYPDLDTAAFLQRAKQSALNLSKYR